MNRKIYHASLFFDELDLLKLKLGTECNYVDAFFLSESDFTHSGLPKPYILHDNSDMFYKYSNIIVQNLCNEPFNIKEVKYSSINNELYNLVVDKIKAHTHYDKNNIGYFRDSWEKESLIRALWNCNEEDIIILSDLDEIIRPEAIEWLRENFEDDKIYYFDSKVYYYYLNLRKDEPWKCPLAMSFKKFKETSFCVARNFPPPNSVVIPNGGWHYSYQSGIDAIKNKLKSFGEQSLNLPWVKNGLEKSIDNAIESGRDLYGRKCKFWIEDINYENSPKYLVDHQDEFAHMIKSTI